MQSGKPQRDPRPAEQVVKEEGVAKAIGLKHVASILYTYRCTIACAHCLFNCKPTQPDVHVGLDDGLEFLSQLYATDRVVHIAGGEALIYFGDVLELCKEAARQGIAPHFIESNAKWCSDDKITWERLTALKDAGVRGFFFSADPFHQAFFPPENRLRAFNIAVQVFGRENIIAADMTLEQLEEVRRIGRDKNLLAQYVREHPPRMVGRAGEVLAQFIPERPIDGLDGDALWHGTAPDGDCAVEFDPETMWEIHIDPYGNIQTCCGIILGNAHETPLPELAATGFHTANPMVKAVYEHGPRMLLQLAMQKGYRPSKGYVQKCHLCWEVRKFLRPYFPEALGPAEIYER